MVKCTERASRGPSPHMAAYTSVTLALQGSDALSCPPRSICTHVECRLTSRQNTPSHPHTHTKKKKNRKELKSQNLSLDGLELPSASATQEACVTHRQNSPFWSFALHLWHSGSFCRASFLICQLKNQITKIKKNEAGNGAELCAQAGVESPEQRQGQGISANPGDLTP